MNYQLAFITGATSGLGKELAFLLAKKGIPLLLTGRQETALHSLQKELENLTSVTVFPADLFSPSDVENLLQKLSTHKPDLVINNAGIGFYGDIFSFSLEEQMQIIQINIDTLVRISLKSAHILKEEKRPGTILNISSMAGHFIYPYFSVYAASKRFVEHFSLSLDAELSQIGIRVLTSILGRFASPFFKKARGPISLDSWDVMPLSKTAKHVLNQIEKQKSSCIIDYRYKILQLLSYIVPKKITLAILKRTSS